jgi:4-aminobutyrate aminotransferase
MSNAPSIKTPLPGPRAKAIIERDQAVVSPSYTRGYPLVIARGQGATVEDVDGNVFLDCAAGIAVNSTGHAHPDVVRAITEQAQKFLHMSGTDFYYEPQVRLAEDMAAIAPIAGGVRTFFANSGTEAVEACLKLARYATGRSNLIAFLGGFHGRTMGSLSLTSSKAIQRRGFGPLMPGVYHAPYADCYRCPLGLNPESCAAECLDFIDHQIFVHLVSPDEVAAIVVEPVQGEGGYVVAPDQFLQRLRDLTRPHGILFVADEVQSGMGRSGKMFAIEYSGVEPDMMAIAKGIASGMPLGVAIARSGLMAGRRACEHIRRQPGVVRGRDCDDHAAPGHPGGTRRTGAHFLAQGVDGEASVDRRCARPRTDGRGISFAIGRRRSARPTSAMRW